MPTLREYIEGEYHWYRRTAEEDKEFEDDEQTAYDRGRRDAYFSILQKMTSLENNKGGDK